jgi:hypothetical protein
LGDNRLVCIPRLLCVLAAFAALSVSSSASAEECPALEGAPATATIDGEVRLQRISGVLDDQSRKMNIWNWGWGLGFAAASAAQYGAVFLVDDEGRKVDLVAGGSKAFIGAASVLVLPLGVEEAPESTGDVCADLAEAEKRLIEGVRQQRKGRTLFRHSQGVALNVVTVFIVGFGWDRWIEGLIGALIGTAVGEVRIWTQPTGAIDTLRKYREGKLSGLPTSSETAWSVVPVVSQDHVGGAFVLSF